MKKIHCMGLWLGGCLAALVCAHAGEQLAVVKGDNVNVRGQPTVFSEVVAQLQRAEKVLVLEELTVEKPKDGDVAKWSRIQMPDGATVWVYASFVEPETHTVTVSRLNIRSGPGQNYSVVGRIDKGTEVKALQTVNDWIEILPPPGAYAFVASDLLEKAPAPAPARGPEVSKPPEPLREPPAEPAPVKPANPATPVNEAPRQVQPLEVYPDRNAPVEPAPTEPAPARVEERPPAAQEPAPVEPAVPPEPATGAPEIEPLPAIEAPQLEPAAPQPPKRRIVRREGIVRSTISIQAPTYFALDSSDSGKTINYLHNPSADLKLRDYKGRRVIVTGEEGIDVRWPRTPVIEVETIRVVE